MTYKQTQYRQCSRKDSYYTTKEVNSAIHRIQKRTKTPLTYYKCPICHKYHLTSSTYFKENFDERHFA